MGCDGGTIPRRDELVKTKKKPEEKDRDAEQAAKWQFCALSCTKLNRPIVSCDLGRLYNKDSIIEYLLNRDTFAGDVASHIRNLKDITELVLTEKKDYDDRAGKGGQYIDTQNSRYICPVVGLEMSGKYKFYYLRGCGCVVSERAIKEVKTESCHNCGKEFRQDDLIVINGSDEEVVELRRKMEERRALAKSERKGKKRKVEAAAGSGDATSSSSNADDGDAQKKLMMKNGAASTSSGSRGPSKKSTTKTSTTALLSEKASDGYSVAKDPNASETYKSIFTTHQSAKNRPKAHWVTFNPLFN